MGDGLATSFMSAERRFLDTNVLVYLFDADNQEKRNCSRDILLSARASESLVLSTQVLQEFYVAATRKLARPLDPELACEAVRNFTLLSVHRVTESMVLAAIRRSISARLSFWDSLIVEAALESGSTILLTEDMQHGQVFDDVRVENPFRDCR